jgi:uncharacterized protein YbjT (DUF2867 family)
LQSSVTDFERWGIFRLHFAAIGASIDSRFFYARMKGELEKDVQAIGFQSLTNRPTEHHTW